MNAKSKNRLAVAILLLVLIGIAGVIFYDLLNSYLGNLENKKFEGYIREYVQPRQDLSVKRTTRSQNGFNLTAAAQGNIDSPITLDIHGGKISFTSIPNHTLGGLNQSKLQVSEGKIIYDNIYNGINLIYTPSKQGVLEEYEIRSKRDIEYLMQKIDVWGLTYKTQADGSIIFTNSKGKFAFAIPRPVMYEEFNTKNKNFGMHYRIIQYKGNTYLVKIIDKEGKDWLSKTNYPVMIDATVLLTLFSYSTYPTVNNNWQIGLQTVGSGNLTIKPSAGTTWTEGDDSTKDLNNLVLICGGKEVSYQLAADGYPIFSNFSCDSDIMISVKVNSLRKQNSLDFTYSGLTTSIASIADNGKPVIVSSSVNPPVVKVGDTITVKAEVGDSRGVASVSADFGGIENVSLSLVSGNAQDGIWQGSWIVHGTGTKEYKISINASNGTSTSQAVIGFFDPYSCTGGGDHAGAAWDPATDCPSGFAGNHTNIATLSVANGETATVKTFDGTNYGIATMSATTVTITGTISSNGTGFPGGPDTTGLIGAGGSHGGLGGPGLQGRTPNPQYDSLTYPGQMGNGGWGGQGGTGGTGGGVIQIVTTGTLTINSTGVISSNGNNSSGNQAGGGAGGSVYISAASLVGSGSITANGGQGIVNSGGGGGGRIAVFYSSSSSYTGSITVTGGASGAGAPGGDGTDLIENSSTQDLTIPSNNGAWNGGDMNNWSFNNLTINGNVTFRPSNGQLFIATASGTTTIAAGITIMANGGNTSSTQGVGSGGVGVYLNLTGNVTIPTTTTISSNGQGYVGGPDTVGQFGSGGSYGGVGGTNRNGTPGSSTYGSPTAPVDLGYGGNGGQGGVGGNGGGAIKIHTTGTLTINGTISSNASNASGNQSGGGAGGSVFLLAGTIAGGGNIFASGSAGLTNAGGGAGGRIALLYSIANNFSGVTGVGGAPGGGGGSSGPGASGTVNINLSYNCNTGGDHLGSDWDPATACPSGFAGNHTNIGTLSVGSGETATVQAFDQVSSYGIATLSAATVTIASTGLITADAKGWGGGASGHPNGSGPGGGYGNSYVFASGGGYGGNGGGSNSYSSGGGVYGSLAYPGDLGSGGGADVSGGSNGGAGGGTIRIVTTGTLTVSGTISSNGGAGGGGGGAGSGGSIWITAATLAGNGSITANGGNADASTGGGGGGRIAIYYTSVNTYSGTPTVTTGTGVSGVNGTAFIENLSTGDLTIPSNNGKWYGNDQTPWTFHDVTFNANITFQPTNATLLTFTSTGTATIASGITITAGGSYTTNSNGVGVFFNLTGNVTIPITSSIVSDNQGYAGGDTITGIGVGPGGGGGGSGCWGGGGGYGGVGGTGGCGAGGTTYGSLPNPGDLGSGGGRITGSGNPGGYGGGAIRISTTGTLTISGSISSNGGAAGNGGGGGAGGSIWITAATLAGNGSITANGGNADASTGGGGGGRIAIYYTSVNTYSGTPTVTTGTGVSGVNGTAFIENLNTNDLLIPSANGTWYGSDLASWNFGNLTINGNITFSSSNATLLTITSTGTTTIASSITISVKGSYTNDSNGAGVYFKLSGNVTIPATSSIISDSLGYSGGLNGHANGYGTGGGQGCQCSAWGAGGGYGGVGGGSGSYPSGGGITYGSSTSPLDLGSGAGADVGGGTNGTTGGGAIKLTTNGTLTVSGTLSSNAGNGGGGGGGGSGGSIYLIIGTLAGNGTIRATGGNTNGQGGSGGGGRIAIYYNTNSWSGNSLTAAGAATAGTGGAGGGVNGTVVLTSTYTCLTGGDHYGISFDPANDCPSGFAGNHYDIDNLFVNNGETATVYAFNQISSYGIATMSAASVNIAGTLTAKGSGWAGGSTNGTGPGAGLCGCSANSGSGGGYGGVGRTSGNNNPGGPAYGLLSTPGDLGSGGGSNGIGIGGSGGGAIKITTTGTLTVSGTITANGNDGVSAEAGGGSGGSIYLSAGSLAGNGTISANGGAYGGNQGGGGGGGRIAVYYINTNTYTGNTTATVGTGGATILEKYYGTAFINNSTTGDIILPSNNGSWKATDLSNWTFHDLTINGGVILQATNAALLTLTATGSSTLAAGITITAGSSYTNYSNGVGVYFNLAGNVTLPSTSTIIADHLGYPGGSQNGTGPGAGLCGCSSNSGSGAGYGGVGRTSLNNNPGGPTYGSLEAPLDLGSGGGSNGIGMGGQGGGAIKITTTGTLTVNGIITVNGNNGTGNEAGGGSGGSIYLSAGSLAGNGTISANGGGATNSGGGGSGGRIAVYYTNTNNFSGTVTETFGSGGNSTLEKYYGTAFIKNSVTGDMTIPSNNGSWKATDVSNWNFHDLTINGGVILQATNAALLTLTATGTSNIGSGVTITAVGSNTNNSNGVGVYFNLAGNVTLPSTSTITADAQGYLGGSAAGTGPGAGLCGCSSNSGSGGGYGGKGMTSANGNPGGPAYGSLITPTDLGSGGGSNTIGFGGQGGGAIKITTTGVFNILGSITSNGGNGAGNEAGGGSGGSIFITMGELEGNGTIKAIGGNATNSGGGGGGGRIALLCSAGGNWLGNSLASASATATGIGGNSGGAGTVYDPACFPTNSKINGKIRINGNTRFQ